MTVDSPRQRLALAALLFVATLFVFRPALACDFVNFDDPLYVQNNPILFDGLSGVGVERAFTTIQGGYWIPLTWLSYLIDFHFSGLNPSGYHRTNILLHAATAALLFLTLCRMTAAPGRSLAVAAFFAVHPIQVESVAWVTERKDVLSTFFLVLALLAYTGYANRPGLGRYLLVVLCFVLGLMAKPMLVTLPVVLLVLDFWPLNRGALGPRRLVLEKAPLILLAFAAGVLTIVTQRHGTAVRSLDEFSLYARLGNALVCYVVYLRMLLWPYPLAVFYPHPGNDLPFWQPLLAASLLLALTMTAFRLRRRAPYLLAGWLWYAISLAPVSGILQAGWQGRADRFVYVPSIGLFVLAVWGMADLIGTRRRLAAAILATCLLSLCVAVTTRQIPYWRDSVTLWEHTAAVTDDNFVCRHTLAAALLDRGRTAEAVEHLERAIALKPDHELAYYLLGLARRQQKRLDEAERWLREALKISPEYVEALAVLAEVLAEEKRLDEAEQTARRALELDPRSAVATASLAAIRLRQGLDEEGLELLRTAVSLDPHDASLRLRLADELRRRGLDAEADRQDEALRSLYQRGP